MTAALVLIHAFPLGPWMWREVIPPIAAVSGADLLAPALPGFAGKPAPSHAPDLVHFADEVLADAPDRFVAAGCSLGGYVVMELMRRAPDRLAGVILLDTKPEPDSEAARERRHEVAAGVEREGVGAWVDVLTAPLLGSSTQASDPDLVAEVRAQVLAADPIGVAWAQRAMALRPDSRGTLANWKRPALVIVGEEDQLSPVATAREMAELLPLGELAVIERAGHLAAIEQPERVAEAIATWWATSFPPAE